MSCDYYARLEQARGSRPSRAIIAALVVALRCDPDQADHLFHLAGLQPPPRPVRQHIGAELLAVVDRLADIPLWISNDIDDVVWQNALADALFGELSGNASDDNLARRWFTQPDARRRVPEADWPQHSAAYAGHLRATAARRAGHPDVTTLVADLMEGSEEFRLLWARHDVTDCRLDRIRILHPEVGLVHLSCELLQATNTGLRIMAFVPTEGFDAQQRLELLRVIGTQRFEPIS